MENAAMNIHFLEQIIERFCARQASIPVVLGSGGLGLIQSLGEKGVRSIVIDDGPSSVRDFSRYCRRITVADISAAWDRLCEALRMVSSLALKHSGNRPIIFPTSDYILHCLAGRYDELKSLAAIAAPSHEVILLTLDKASFYQWLLDHDFPCPRTVFPSCGGEDALDVGNISFPCIVKPALTFMLEQAAGRKLYVAADRSELVRCCRDLSERNMEYVIQEIVPGRDEDQFSLAGYCRKGGEIAGYVMTNKLRQSYYGAGTFVAGSDVPGLYETGVKLLRELDYHGIFEIEFRRDARDGTYRIIELNPRCWSQIILATRMNVNVAYCAYRDLSGLECRGEMAGPSGAKKYWVNFERDLGHLKRKFRENDYTLGGLVSVMLSIPSIEPFSLRDPKPGLCYLKRKITRRLAKGVSAPGRLAGRPHS